MKVLLLVIHLYYSVTPEGVPYVVSKETMMFEQKTVAACEIAAEAYKEQSYDLDAGGLRSTETHCITGKKI